MTGSALQAVDVVYAVASRREVFSLEKGRGPGEGIVERSIVHGRLSDDGKRFAALDVVYPLLLGEKKGKGVRGKGALPDRSSAGGWRIYVGALGVFSGFVKVAEGRFLR